MDKTTSHSSAGSISETAAAECHSLTKRAENYIRQKPLQAAGQAALLGYAMQYFPLRTALSAAARLAVPGIFLAGLFRLADSFRRPPGK